MIAPAAAGGGGGDAGQDTLNRLEAQQAAPKAVDNHHICRRSGMRRHTHSELCQRTQVSIPGYILVLLRRVPESLCIVKLWTRLGCT